MRQTAAGISLHRFQLLDQRAHQGLAAEGVNISGDLQRALPGGLYFSRVRVDGRMLGSTRVAVVR